MDPSVRKKSSSSSIYRKLKSPKKHWIWVINSFLHAWQRGVFILMIWFTDPLNLAPQEDMQIKIHLHLLSLCPFMLHIGSGNKSLIEFMKHKSQITPRARSVTRLMCWTTGISKGLPVTWHALTQHVLVITMQLQSMKLCFKSDYSFRKWQGEHMTVFAEITHRATWSISSWTASLMPRIRHQTRFSPPPHLGLSGGALILRRWWLSFIRYGRVWIWMWSIWLPQH